MFWERTGKFGTMSKLLTVLLLLMLMVSAIGVVSAESSNPGYGVITIDMNNAEFARFGNATVTVGLYKVASLKDNTWTAIGSYKSDKEIASIISKLNSNASPTAQEADAAIFAADKIAQKESNYGTMQVGYGRSPKSTQLELGVYLVKMLAPSPGSNNEVLYVNPFFVYLRSDVTVNPKVASAKYLEVEKVWDDNNNKAGIRPDWETFFASLKLMQNETTDVTAEYKDNCYIVLRNDKNTAVSAYNHPDRTITWEDNPLVIWERLPEELSDKELKYSVTEGSFKNYTSTKATTTGTNGARCTLTNKLSLASLKIVKTVKLSDNATTTEDLTFYFSVHDAGNVYYKADGSVATTEADRRIAVKAGDTDGVVIPLPLGTYTVTELSTGNSVPSGYELTKVTLNNDESTTSVTSAVCSLSEVGSSYTVNAVNHYGPTPTPTPSEMTPTPTPTLTPSPSPTPAVTQTPETTTPTNTDSQITNTPRPTQTPTVAISGTKMWVDDNNSHGLRPSTISVDVYANGQRVDADVTLSGRGDTWSYQASGLPAQDANGNTINYSFVENSVSGYETNVNGTTITNRLITHEPTTYQSITMTKSWDDGGAEHPSTIVVDILRNGQVIDTVTVAEANGWAYTFDNLPTDDGYGNTYTYTFQEHTVSGYYMRLSGNQMTNSRITTTYHEPELPFSNYTMEELEDLIDIFDYGTPLYGVLGTGNEIPVYVFITGGVGIVAILLLVIFGRKKKKQKTA